MGKRTDIERMTLPELAALTTTLAEAYAAYQIAEEAHLRNLKDPVLYAQYKDALANWLGVQSSELARLKNEEGSK